ncbi:DNA polymerase IV [Bremerella volcania]|uniref:DNA polymerase IV n=2 Tax=Bremerella volcania TaxID=2527984 RepID=A0A518C9I0_9BACT|nr:DNA polymerase IV [Bremerella volcania]
MVVLTESTKRGDFVYQCNDLAKRRGVRPGMPASEAETFAKTHDSLKIRQASLDQDKTALVEVALRCEPYSFCIGLEETDRPECLLMDVTGIAHFFSGEHALLEQLQQELSSQGFETRLAIANTVGMAWAVAHCLETSQRMIVPATDRAFKDKLSIGALRLPETVLAKLGRLGIYTIGQLQKLDRCSLWSRFGEELLRRMDQLAGERPESITSCRPVPRFIASRRLEYGLTQPETIEQLWLSLLERLVSLLSPMRLGTRHLRCHFVMDNRSEHEINIRLCGTTADVRRLANLLRLQLERQHWNAPLVGIRLEALEVAPLDRTQREMLEGASHDQACRFSQLLDRLSSRLGNEAVTRPAGQPNPIPELSVRLVPVTEVFSAKTVEQDALLPLDRPTALFPCPRPIEVIAVIPDGPPTALFWKSDRLEIAQCWGPERIEFGWWLGPFVRRDYYRVETTKGKRLWVFRRLQDDRWFWHGEWF